MKELTKKQRWAYEIIIKELKDNDYIVPNRLARIKYPDREEGTVGSLDPNLFHIVIRKTNLLLGRIDGFLRDGKYNCRMNIYFLPEKFDKIKDKIKTQEEIIRDNQLQRLKEKIKAKREWINQLEEKKKELKILEEEYATLTRYYAKKEKEAYSKQ